MAQALKRRANEALSIQTECEPADDNEILSARSSPSRSLDDRLLDSGHKAVNDATAPCEPVVREWQRRIEPELVSREFDAERDRWDGKRSLCFMFALSGVAWGLIFLTAMLGL